MKRGHCTNLPSRCSKAKSKELLPVTGPRTSCPECGKPVRAVAGPTNTRFIPYLIAGLIILALGLLAWFLFGRSPSSPASPQPQRAQRAQGVDCKNNPALLLSGSDVLGRTLAPELVEAWLKANGANEISRSPLGSAQTRIEGRLDGATCIVLINGPNTADGLSNLAEGTADIAMSAHQLTAEDRKRLSPLGDTTSPNAEHVVAIDALSVIVHPSSSIRKLARGEVADVVSGRVANWSSIGGSSQSINVHIGTSGLRAADTAEELLGTASPKARRFASDAGVIEAVANDPSAIGIVSYPAPSSVRTLSVGEQGATPFQPSSATIATQSYPLTRRLYFYTDPTPSNPNTRSFLTFVQGRQGQAVVTRAGYGGQNVEVVAAPVEREGASTEYRSLVAGARQLNIAFRFRTGSSQPDNKAVEDLSRLVEFIGLQSTAARGDLMLIGFADAQGSDESNLALSEQRTLAVASALEGQGINPATLKWFGEEQPVSDNSTVAGRERNRRVEVWVRE